MLFRALAIFNMAWWWVEQNESKRWCCRSRELERTCAAWGLWLRFTAGRYSLSHLESCSFGNKADTGCRCLLHSVCNHILKIRKLLCCVYYFFIIEFLHTHKSTTFQLLKQVSKSVLKLVCEFMYEKLRFNLCWNNIYTVNVFSRPNTRNSQWFFFPLSENDVCVVWTNV
jgi:hypothetical protein